ncbi:MAG: type VII toxin-antitoxin system MntA family adenylyltransferase antitoxin [Egibacteraceae bacterium]
MIPDDLAARVGASQLAGLHLLVLHGSRARGDAGPLSDWDFGFLADDRLDAALLRARLTVAVGTEAVDLVDLARASALLRFRAARDARVLFERDEAEFRRFQLEAVRFWCDAGPVIRAAHDEILAALG